MMLLLVGASGLVGSHVLRQALGDDRIKLVVAPTRRALPAHRKLVAPVVDFDRLPDDAPWCAADAVICTLGTTMRVAGSREAFRKVDHDYPLAVARSARRHGTPTFVLNSATGADVASRFFYNRVKGDVERDILALEFRSVTIARPGLIGGERKPSRTVERCASRLLKLFGPALPRRWHINPADVIATRMLEAALGAASGDHIICSADLTGMVAF